MRMPSSDCPHCGVRLNLLRALGWQCPACGRRPRPLALWFLMVYSLLVFPVSLYVLAASLAGVSMVPVDGAGQPLTGPSADLFPLALFAATLPAAPLAYGLWHHRGWTRWLLPAWLAWMSVVMLPVVAGLRPPVVVRANLAFQAAALVSLLVYLYTSRTIRAYYADVAGRDGRVPAG